MTSIRRQQSIVTPNNVKNYSVTGSKLLSPTKIFQQKQGRELLLKRVAKRPPDEFAHELITQSKLPGAKQGAAHNEPGFGMHPPRTTHDNQKDAVPMIDDVSETGPAIEGERVHISDIQNPDQKKFAKRKRPPRLKHSNFSMTINTNVRFKHDSPNLMPFSTHFGRTLETMLAEMKRGKFIKILNPADSWNRETIKSVRQHVVIERGGQTGTVHAACFIGIDHRTRVQIDKFAVQEFICEQMSLETCYIHLQLFKGDSKEALENWRRYIDKNLKASKKKRQDGSEGSVSTSSSEDDDNLNVDEFEQRLRQ